MEEVRRSGAMFRLVLFLLAGFKGGACQGTSFHVARHTGHTRLPYLTLEAMQEKWKEWEHSAVKRAWPCPAFMTSKHIEQVVRAEICREFRSLAENRGDTRAFAEEDSELGNCVSPSSAATAVFRLSPEEADTQT